MLKHKERKTGTIVPGDLVCSVYVNVFDEEAIKNARKAGIRDAVQVLIDDFAAKYQCLPTSINMDSSDKRRLAEVINDHVEEMNEKREEGTPRMRTVDCYGDFVWEGIKYTSGCSLDLGKVSLRSFMNEEGFQFGEGQ